MDNEQKSPPPAANGPSSSDQRALLKKRTFLVLRCLSVAIVYAVLARSIDFGKLSVHLTRDVLIALIAAGAIILLQAAFCTWRWQFIGKYRSPFVPNFMFSFWAYEENLFVNLLLPSTVGGDVIRTLRWQDAGVRGLPAASSVFLDRLAGINGAAVLAVVAIPYILHSSTEIRAVGAVAAAAAFVMLATAAGFLVVRWPTLVSPLRRFPRFWEIAEALRLNLTWDRTFLISVGLSVIGHVVGGLAVYVLSLAIGLKLGVFGAVAVTSLSVLATAVPITVGGWGLREMSFVAFLTPLGIATQDAFVLGFLFGLANLLAALPGGFAIAFGWTTMLDSKKV